MEGSACAAAIARPADADDSGPCQHMIEHLADRLANQVQFAAAAGACLMPDIEPDVLARQMHWQAWPLAGRLRPERLLRTWSLASVRARSA